MNKLWTESKALSVCSRLVTCFVCAASRFPTSSPHTVGAVELADGAVIFQGQGNVLFRGEKQDIHVKIKNELQTVGVAGREKLRTVKEEVEIREDSAYRAEMCVWEMGEENKVRRQPQLPFSSVGRWWRSLAHCGILKRFKQR
jgi:hypothetical protein